MNSWRVGGGQSRASLHRWRGQEYRMTLEVFDQLEFTGWDGLLAGRPEATVFHTASWVRVLHEAYGLPAVLPGSD